jgi:hypothetical protein
MFNSPDQDTQGMQPPSGKLILPGPSQGSFGQSYNTQIRPEQLIRPSASAAPSGFFSRLAFLWRTEPIYRILWLAITMVIIASIVFVAFGASAFLNNNTPNPNTQTTALQPAATPNPTPTATAIPTPTPTVVPTPTPTAVPTPTPTAIPTPTPTAVVPAALTVQTTTLPVSVQNNTSVHVGVLTNQPGVTVVLQVTYNVAPGIFRNTTMTDNGGNGNFTWNVAVFSFNRNGAQATVQVTATSSSGQQAASTPVTVAITNN